MCRKVKVQVQCMVEVEDSMLQASKVPVALEPLAFQGLPGTQGLPTKVFQAFNQGFHSYLPKPHPVALLLRPLFHNNEVLLL